MPDRGGPFLGQEHMSSCAPLIEPPNKLSRNVPKPSSFLLQNHQHSGFPLGCSVSKPILHDFFFFFVFLSF